jgi:serine/threonine protein phosphatase 1
LELARTIAIGDIHGCAKALRTLIDAIEPCRDDTIVCLGDYIDRGSDSRDVVDQVLELEGRCQLIPLLGNHEIMLMAVLRGGLPEEVWRENGGDSTIVSYGGSLDRIPSHHRQFFRRCRRYYETEKAFFVHAGYLAHEPLEVQPDQVLFWEHLLSIPPPRHLSGRTAFVGHTPQRSGRIVNWGHVVCVDTYCFGGGYLTAVDCETLDCWQADRHGILREPNWRFIKRLRQWWYRHRLQLREQSHGRSICPPAASLPAPAAAVREGPS